MRILFVCTGNAYRSPVAEALLKKYRPEIESDSAGIDPAIPVSEVAKTFLAHENAQKNLKAAPEGLDRKQLESYDLIVAMKPEHRRVVVNICPGCANNVVVWDIDDPYFLPHGHAEKIFHQIKYKVIELANSI